MLIRSLLAELVVAALVSAGSPATAAPDRAVQAGVFLRDLTLPADGPAVDELLSVFLTADRAGWANEVVLTVDTSAVTAVADVTVKAYPGATCPATGLVVRCVVPGPHRVVDPPDSGGFGVVTTATVMLGLTSKPGAAAGDAGALTVTARADGGPATTETARVRIGEGVNLTAIDTRPRSVAPGGGVALRPQVHNTGSRDVRGLTLVVGGGAVAGTDFGNCTYGDVVVCTFDTPVAAGRTYRVSAPFTVRAPRDAAVGSETGLGVQWVTRAEWQDWQDTAAGPPADRPGAGPFLELDELDELAAAAAAQVPQADTDGDDNGTFTTVTVSGRRRADVVAVGARISGSPGRARTLGVGLVNRGPGTLRYPPFDNNVPALRVTLPPGLSVLRADERCWAPDGEDPAGTPPSTATGDSRSSEYVCRPEAVVLRPGQRLSFTFTARVTPGARDGSGSVDVTLAGDDAVDRDAGNNSAPLILTVQGRDGGLPVTGSTTATAARGGLLLLLAGAAVMVMVRRRNRLRRG